MHAQTASGIVNVYFKVTDFVPAYNGVRVQNITGLATGDRVMLIQMKGASINETNTSSFGNISSIGNAGKYEFATICSFLNDTVVFERELINTYDYTQAVQLIYVPQYTDVTINGTLLAKEWDPVDGTGGVIAIEASGTITMNAAISADSAGYKGGLLFNNSVSSRCGSVSGYYFSTAQSTDPGLGGATKGEGVAAFITNKETGRGKQANGGGGGNVDNTGGGGGSNYGTGGDGGNRTNTTLGICNANTFGYGGLPLSSYGYSSVAADNRIFMGGGGGCGEMNNTAGTAGGDGGGIIFIKCNQLIANGFTISANGAQGINPIQPVITEASGDGGGGGGGGGVVILDVASYSGSLNVQANGANGSNAGFQNQCPGPGGGGGGGVIWYSGTLPGTVTATAAGGANGIIKNAPAHNPPCEGLPNGATSGTNGMVQPGFQITEGAVYNCGGLLPASAIKEWYGKRVSDGVELNWKLEQTDAIEIVSLEKRNVRGWFKTLKEYQSPADGAFQYLDASNEFPVTYRLLIRDKSGRTQYSSQLFFERQKAKRLNVYPNPVADELRIEIPVSTAGKTSVSVFDYTGKQVMRKEIMISRNQVTTIPLGQLAAGTYTVQLFWKDELYIGKIVKQ